MRLGTACAAAVMCWREMHFHICHESAVGYARGEIRAWLLLLILVAMEIIKSESSHLSSFRGENSRLGGRVVSGETQMQRIKFINLAGAEFIVMRLNFICRVLHPLLTAVADRKFFTCSAWKLFSPNTVNMEICSLFPMPLGESQHKHC